MSSHTSTNAGRPRHPSPSTELKPPDWLHQPILTEAGVQLSWALKDGQAPTRYSVLRDGVPIAETDEPVFIDTTATPNTTYTYTVRAIDPIRGESSVDSLPVTVRTVGPVSGGSSARLTGSSLSGDERADLVLKSNGVLYAYYNNGVRSDKGINWDQTDAGGYVVGEGWGIPDSSLYFADLNGDHPPT
jgi:hypothetical protein